MESKLIEKCYSGINKFISKDYKSLSLDGIREEEMIVNNIIHILTIYKNSSFRSELIEETLETKIINVILETMFSRDATSQLWNRRCVLLLSLLKKGTSSIELV